MGRTMYFKVSSTIDFAKGSSMVVVVEDEIDLCVICHRPTDYPRSTPIDLRMNYVPGAGQKCDVCAKKLSAQ
jgi:hypothetical protein